MSHLDVSYAGASSNRRNGRSVDPHPGAMHAQMPQYLMLPDQRRIERVPRSLYLSPPHESIPGITFSAHGRPGVRVRDILKDTVTVDDANDTIFEEHGWRSTVVHLEWPGYGRQNFNDPMRARIDVCPGGVYMTRQDLAREVCILLFHFHEAISKCDIAPEWEKWALTTGSEGIRVRDIVLLSIHYYRNVWVPELYVIE